MRSKPLVLILAALGILLSHDFAYRVFSSVKGTNLVGLLSVTGHDWYEHLVPIAASLVALSLFLMFTTKKNASFTSILAAQSLGFVSLEISERLIFGGSYTDLSYIIILGLLFQIPAASVIFLYSAVVFYFKERSKIPSNSVYVLPRTRNVLESIANFSRILCLSTSAQRAPPFIVSLV